MLALSNDHLIELLSPAMLIESVAAAARSVDAGGANVPSRMHVDWSDNTLLLMPAVDGRILSTKLVSIVPGNAKSGLPVTNGLMVLNDAETGLPLAIMNAAGLTALRTGAVGALGITHITPAHISSVGIIGCGVQGTWQAIFACAVRPIKEVFYIGRSEDRMQKFVKTLARHAPGVKATRCKDASDLLARTNLVIAATTSSEPVLPDNAALLERKHFISIGSYKPSMQELPDSVYRLAGTIVIDSEAARHEVGDVINPTTQGAVAEKNVFSIGRLVSGQRSLDLNKVTVFKSVGMALYDLHVAHGFFLEATRRNIGQAVSL